MLTSTTPQIAGQEIAETLGVVTGEAIIGANIFRDLLAGITDIVGGRSRPNFDHVPRVTPRPH